MGPGAKILVVDDEADTVGLLELTLRTAGYHVQIATGGEQALRKIQEESFDLVLLDLMMPDLSGYDVLRRLLHNPGQAPPVVILTARSQPEDREAGRNLGAVAFLVKPTSRGDLLDTIQSALSSPRRDAPS